MQRSERGFTLAEVLIAVFLLGGGVLAIAPMFVYSVKDNNKSAEMNLLGSLAMERMELLRSTEYRDLDAGGELDRNVSVNGVPYFDISNTGYVIRWQITDDVPRNGVKAVTTTALKRQGRFTRHLPQRKVTFSTLRVK
ncbi:MAG: prepilin-type N-terminal cleavage/methylation domain-containing protein [bacterium]|nr:prepilin-type N-terminal cleavage/methylation domain-containing protein [bacterium]